MRARLLPVSSAFHSPLVAPAQRRLAEFLGQLALGPPRLPVFSNTTAGLYPESPSEIAALLGEHLVRPVEFVAEIEAMYRAGARIFVEVGPRSVLSGLVGRILRDRPHVCVSLDQPGRHGLTQLLHGLAQLVTEGVPLRLGRLYRGRTVRLLDLAALEKETGEVAHSPTTWLVNGGRARPIAPRPGPPGRARLRPLGWAKAPRRREDYGRTSTRSSGPPGLRRRLRPAAGMVSRRCGAPGLSPDSTPTRPSAGKRWERAPAGDRESRDV